MENWRDELPDDLKTSTNLAKYDTLEDALRGGDAAAGRLGRSITIPGEDATDDERTRFTDKLQAHAPNLTIHPDHADEEHQAEFWKLAGVPGESKGYVAPEGFDGLPVEIVDNLREKAHAAGLTTKQFKAQLPAFEAEYQEQQEAHQTMMSEDAAVVSGAWGMAEESKKGAIAALISKFEDPNHKLGELNAAAYLLLDNIVKAFTGKGPQVFEQPNNSNALTPDEIDEKLHDINTALMKSGHGPQHKRLLLKKVKLLEMRE